MNTVILQAAAQQQGGGMQMIIMMVVLFAIVYFFMIRPQNKKQKEIQKFRNALTVGQNVVTIGGIHGTVKGIDEEAGTVSLEVASGVKITFSKDAINPVAEKK
ncbi:preprotein translocase subunit YajC [bacterium]|nr:preprotein translocase subunit YajC [bacterium]